MAVKGHGSFHAVRMHQHCQAETSTMAEVEWAALLQAMEGPCVSGRPAFWDLKARSKWCTCCLGKMQTCIVSFWAENTDLTTGAPSPLPA